MFKKICRLSLGLSVSIFIFGCGGESATDTVTRRLDLEHEQTKTIADSYQEMAGFYSTDSKRDKSAYDFVLETRVLFVRRDGFLTPFPSLAGRFYARAHTTKTETPDPYIQFQFYNGMYDEALHLTTILMNSAVGDNNGIVVNCKVVDDNTRLECSWNPALAAEAFEFKLKRISDKQAALLLKKK